MRGWKEMERVKAPWELASCEKDTPVLLALSGGADSRFLLHVLAQFAKRDGFLLFLAHVNHGIRGEAALCDRDFCISLAREYGLEIFVRDVDVPRLAKERGKSIEEAARELRYEFFAELMQAHHIPLLVTAHNADDNAETVLFRMARGSGLLGLCGIAPVRSFSGGMLVRPMLGVTKREIVAFCEQNALRYVTDETNCDAAYARNRVRAEVLPVLESLFEGATERIGEMSASLREDEELLSSMADRFLREHEKDGALPIVPLLSEARALQGRILSRWLTNTAGISPERVHLEAILRLCKAGEAHSELTLPRATVVAIEKGMLCVKRARGSLPCSYELPFREGEQMLPDGSMSVFVKKNDKNLKVHNLSTAPYIFLKKNFDIMKDRMYWRPRRDGDRILMGGMHREVRRLYREAGLSMDVRARLPLLCDEEGIVWIPYVGARDGAEERDLSHGGIFVSFRKIKPL